FNHRFAHYRNFLLIFQGFWETESPTVRGRGLKQQRVVTFAHRAVSPTVRGRGLKHDAVLMEVRESKSPTVRGRGLKQNRRCPPTAPSGSPTVRGRGLKLPLPSQVQQECCVAHRAWAWVET